MTFKNSLLVLCICLCMLVQCKMYKKYFKIKYFYVEYISLNKNTYLKLRTAFFKIDFPFP